MVSCVCSCPSGYIVASSVSICFSCYLVWPAMSLLLLVVPLVVRTYINDSVSCCSVYNFCGRWMDECGTTVFQFRHQKLINRLQFVCVEVSAYYCFTLRLFILHSLESACWAAKYLSASTCTFRKTRQPALCSDITKTNVMKPKTQLMFLWIFILKIT